MVISKFTTGIQKLAGAFAAVFLVLGANPALANSSTAADIAAPLRAAQDTRQSALNNGDEEFRQLFSSWRSLDRPSGYVAPSVSSGLAAPGLSGLAAPLAAGRVAIPSRMPVEGVRLTSDFGMRTHPVLGGRRGHKGVDLAGPVGTPVIATADGVVSKAEWFSSYGLYVSLEHGAEIQTRYGHMSRLNVYGGQRVRKGDVIGYIGSTGRSTGPHLHYEVRIAGLAVNPVPYMQTDSFETALAANTAASPATSRP